MFSGVGAAAAVTERWNRSRVCLLKIAGNVQRLASEIRTLLEGSKRVETGESTIFQQRKVVYILNAAAMVAILLGIDGSSRKTKKQFMLSWTSQVAE